MPHDSSPARGGGREGRLRHGPLPGPPHTVGRELIGTLLPTMHILYGIKNCDTVRKARAWLDAHGVSYRFHDLRGDGLDAATLNIWLQQVDTATLINTRGTTWRQLPENARQIGDNNTAVRLMLEHPTLIKRPVLVHDGRITVGFSTTDYTAIFSR